MSDNNKKKDGANSASASKGPSKGAKGVCERLSKILSLVSEIKDDPAGFAEHEAIVANRDSLKKQLGEQDSSLNKQLQQKDAVIKKLNDELLKVTSYKESLFQDLEARYKEFGNRTRDHDALKDDLTATEKKLKEATDLNQLLTQENDSIQHDLESCQADLKTLESQLSFKDKELGSAQQELLDTKETLKTRTEELGINRLTQLPLEERAVEIHNLAKDCHKLAWKFFRSTVISNRTLGTLRNELQNTNDLPLSTSRSQAAQLIRCAVAEHLIVKSMMEHIFADLNVPGYNKVQASIFQVLNGFDTESASGIRRRNIVRGQLFSEFSELDHDPEIFNQVIKNTVDQCEQALHFVLSEDDLRSRFRAELQLLYERALHLWLPLRKSLQRVVVESDDNVESTAFPEYDGIKLQDTLEQRWQQPEDGHVVLQLFPQIVSDDGVLCSGYALFSTQRAVYGASVEESNPSPTESVNGHGPATMTRRLSGAQHTRRLSTSNGSVGLTSTRNRGHTRTPQTASLAGVQTDVRNGA